MTKDRLLRHELKNYFKDNETFKVSDIDVFYKQYEPNLKRGTLDWRIYELVQEGVIQRIGRGTYTMEKVNKFTPEISISIKQLFGKLRKEFPYTEMCIWTTKWLTPWMLHLPSTSFTIVESESGTEENVFYYLQEIRKNVFLMSSNNVLEKYADINKEIIIVKTLVSQSPISKRGTTVIPDLEKILVDIAIDKELYKAFQGRDLREIYTTVQQRYAINQNKLLRYAQRRTKKELIENLLEETK